VVRFPDFSQTNRLALAISKIRRRDATNELATPAVGKE
jgi:hypothetical protein